MTSLAEVRHLPRREQLVNPYYNISARLGLHVEPSGVKGLYTQLENGDLNASVWFKEVRDSVKRCRPQILTIDSLSSVNVSTHRDTHGMKMNTWLHLPARPSDIGRDGIWLVAADTITANNFAFSPEDSLDQRLKDRIVSNQLKGLSKGKDTAERMVPAINPPVSQSARIEDIALTAAVTALSLALAEVDEPSFSRRDALRLAAVGLFGLSAASKQFHLFSSEYPKKQVPAYTSAIDERNKKLMDIATNNISGLEWINARNGLYVLKTKDAMDILVEDGDLPELGVPALIVAGEMHKYGINNLLESEEACAEAIRQYVSSLFAVIDRYKKEIDPSLDILKARERLKQVVSEMAIMKVREPKKTDILHSVSDRISDAISIKCTLPSKRVTEALKAA